jgi:hypothetical protein
VNGSKGQILAHALDIARFSLASQPVNRRI